MVLVVLAGTTPAGCGDASSLGEGSMARRDDRAGGPTVRVVRIVDGDTIHVRMASGEREKVRYIGMDTPERGRCWFDQATRANARRVEGRRVRLEYDSDRRDRYGRLLAYIHAGDVFVNEELLRDGSAEALSIGRNTRYAKRFKRLEAQARAQKRGRWRVCRS